MFGLFREKETHLLFIVTMDVSMMNHSVLRSTSKPIYWSIPIKTENTTNQTMVCLFASRTVFRFSLDAIESFQDPVMSGYHPHSFTGSRRHHILKR